MDLLIDLERRVAKLEGDSSLNLSNYIRLIEARFDEAFKGNAKFHSALEERIEALENRHSKEIK
jgi:hypothetical protein